MAFINHSKQNDPKTPAFCTSQSPQNLPEPIDDFSKRVSLSLETKSEPKDYELEGSEEYLADSLSNKMQSAPLNKVSLSQSQFKVTGRGKLGSVGSDSDRDITEKRGKRQDSPGSKADYCDDDVDESYGEERKIVPNSSPVRSPSKRKPFEYSFADSSSKNDSFEVNEPISFVDRVKSISRQKEDFTPQLEGISPSTQAGTIKSGSCYGCEDKSNEKSVLLPKKKTFDKTRIKTNKIKAYLAKAQSLNANAYSPLKSSHSVLDCIKEEESSDSKCSEDNSAYTADPRYFSKQEQLKLHKSATKVERSSYSILAKKYSHDDFIKQRVNLRKVRSSNAQPKQNSLMINRQRSRLRRYDMYLNSNKSDEFCKVEDQENECESLKCW